MARQTRPIPDQLNLFTGKAAAARPRIPAARIRTIYSKQLPTASSPQRVTQRLAKLGFVASNREGEVREALKELAGLRIWPARVGNWLVSRAAEMKRENRSLQQGITIAVRAMPFDFDEKGRPHTTEEQKKLAEEMGRPLRSIDYRQIRAGWLTNARAKLTPEERRKLQWNVNTLLDAVHYKEAHRWQGRIHRERQRPGWTPDLEKAFEKKDKIVTERFANAALDGIRAKLEKGVPREELDSREEAHLRTLEHFHGRHAQNPFGDHRQPPEVQRRVFQTFWSKVKKERGEKEV